MRNDEKICAYGRRRAVLNDGAVSIDCLTLREAVFAWHKLRPERAMGARSAFWRPARSGWLATPERRNRPDDMPR